MCRPVFAGRAPQNPPIYVASNQVVDAPMAAPPSLVAGMHNNLNPCECQNNDDPNCCPIAPGDYEIQFSVEGGNPGAFSLAPTATMNFGWGQGGTYIAKSLVAHIAPSCGALPDVQWSVKAAG